MAAPVLSIRLPAALLSLIDARAERDGRTRSQVVVDVLGEAMLGADTEAPRAPKAQPKPRAALPPIIKASALPDAPKAAPVERAAAGRGGAAMANAGVMVWNGEKRPIYQKGGPAKAKGRR